MNIDLAASLSLSGCGWELREGRVRHRYLMVPVLAALAGGPAWSQETKTYGYDALGRLIASSSSGVPSGGKATAITYDAAGNRTNYRIGGGSTPTPPPTPPPTAPVPLNPGLSVSHRSTTTIQLASLANVSTAATITAFAVPSGSGVASIATGAQSVTYTAPAMGQPIMCEPGETMSVTVPYTIHNTGGASASGTATIVVRGPAGPRPRPGQQCP